MGEDAQRTEAHPDMTLCRAAVTTLEPENCLKIDCVYDIMQIICKVKKPSVYF